jgi:hypothetical protein
MVVLSTALSVVVGVSVIWLGWRNAEPWFAVAGIALIALAPALWFGSRLARFGAIVAGLLSLPVGIYGLWGLGAVIEQRQMCDSQSATASILATSYPADFCTTVNWFTQFGFGFALLGVGISGLILLATAAMDSEHFDRPMRLGAAARH